MLKFFKNFFKERKEKKERENRKRFVRRNINSGEMFLLGEYDRFHRPTRALEDIEAERTERKNKEAEEKAKICKYFGLPESICDDSPDNYRKLKGLYIIDTNREKSEKIPIMSDIFKRYDNADWCYIFRFVFYETENGEPFVQTKYFPMLVEFFKNFGLSNGCADNHLGFGDSKMGEEFAQIGDKGDFADVARCVYTVLSVNKAFYSRGEKLYLDLDTFFEVLPAVYANAKAKAQSKNFSRALWQELSAATGAEEIFYAQYRAYVGEAANKEFWDKH